MILGFEFLIDHGADEVIETEIVFLLAILAERSLRVGCAFDLGLKAKAVLIDEGTLLVGGRFGEFIGIDEGCRALCRFAKMLQMSEFIALRGILLVVPFSSLQIEFRLTFFGESAVRAMQMFLTRNEFVLAVQSAFREVDARRIENLCHKLNILWFKMTYTGLRGYLNVTRWSRDGLDNHLLITY